MIQEIETLRIFSKRRITMEYFIIALIAVMWVWREFVKSMRLNTIEQELEGIRIWT